MYYIEKNCRKSFVQITEEGIRTKYIKNDIKKSISNRLNSEVTESEARTSSTSPLNIKTQSNADKKIWKKTLKMLIKKLNAIVLVKKTD